MKEFDQTNKDKIIEELKEEAKKNKESKGIATCGFAIKGFAWIVTMLLLICGPAFGEYTPGISKAYQPYNRGKVYIYNNSHYRNITPSYNQTYVPYRFNRTYNSYKSSQK